MSRILTTGFKQWFVALLILGVIGCSSIRYNTPSALTEQKHDLLRSALGKLFPPNNDDQWNHIALASVQLDQEQEVKAYLQHNLQLMRNHSSDGILFKLIWNDSNLGTVLFDLNEGSLKSVPQTRRPFWIRVEESRKGITLLVGIGALSLDFDVKEDPSTTIVYRGAVITDKTRRLVSVCDVAPLSSEIGRIRQLHETRNVTCEPSGEIRISPYAAPSPVFRIWVRDPSLPFSV